MSSEDVKLANDFILARFQLEDREENPLDYHVSSEEIEKYEGLRLIDESTEEFEARLEVISRDVQDVELRGGITQAERTAVIIESLMDRREKKNEIVQFRKSIKQSMTEE